MEIWNDELFSALTLYKDFITIFIAETLSTAIQIEDQYNTFLFTVSPDLVFKRFVVNWEHRGDPLQWINQ